ncbi:MAG: hypothetical protein K8R02_05570 [Anaerohalosphaeraceae bacterium]|nr:hypothetical protein [Anaerohalosphaeraceae bacterium]
MYRKTIFFAMLFVAAVLITASEGNAAVLYETGFEEPNFVDGLSVDGRENWNTINNDCTALSDNAITGSMSLEVERMAASDASCYNQFSASGLVTVEFKFKEYDWGAGETGQALAFYLMDNNDKRGVSITFKEVTDHNCVLTVNNSGSDTTVKTGLSDDTVYAIKIEASASAQTYDVWLDASDGNGLVLVADDFGFRYTTGSELTRFKLFSNDATDVGVFDDILISGAAYSDIDWEGDNGAWNVAGNWAGPAVPTAAHDDYARIHDGNPYISTGMDVNAVRVYLGSEPDDDAELDITGGKLSLLAHSGYEPVMYVGYDVNSAGTLNMSGGEIYSELDFHVARVEGSVGNFTMSGGALNVERAIFMGNDGDANVIMSAGAITCGVADGNGVFRIGADTESESHFQLNGGTITVLNGHSGSYFYVAKNCSFDMAGGTLIIDTEVNDLSTASVATGGGASQGVISAKNGTARFSYDVNDSNVTTITVGDSLWAGNLFPENGDEDVNVSTVLAWYPPLDVTSPTYNVYLDTDPNVADMNLISAGQSGTTCEVWLDEKTVYYWRVDAIDPNSGNPVTREGEVWSFTSQTFIDGPDNTLVNPLGGTAAFAITVDNRDLSISSYQWYKESTGIISGADTNELSITNVQDSDKGYYYCKVSSAKGDANSVSGRLLVPELLAHWKLDDAGGDTALEEVNPGVYDGDLVGDTRWAFGENGGAIVLDGDGDYVAAPDSRHFLLKEEVTLACWVNLQSDESWQFILGKSGKSYQLRTRKYENTVGVSLYISSTPVYDANGTVDINDGQWHHIAGVFNGEQSIVYVDGVKDVNFANVGTINTSQGDEPVRIGMNDSERSDQSTDEFTGLIDDARIYTYGLNAVEISNLYNDTKNTHNCGSNPPAADLNGDCVVDFKDLVGIAYDWLDCTLSNGDCP